MLLFVSAIVGTAATEGDVHWTYSGEHGPEHWGELSEAFSACSEGMNQSPIDIVDPVEAELADLELSYGGSTKSIVNNGHTIQVNVGPGNTLKVGGDVFELVQFHVHSPSEHRIEGESFPLEAHFVHRNGRDELAVVGVLFREGPGSRGLGLLGTNAPAEAGGSRPLVVPIEDLELLPRSRAHFRYSGSLTTPPCTEGVMWLVLEATRTIATAQVESFIDLIGEDARGPQPLNGRLVLQ